MFKLFFHVSAGLPPDTVTFCYDNCVYILITCTCWAPPGQVVSAGLPPDTVSSKICFYDKLYLLGSPQVPQY